MTEDEAIQECPNCGTADPDAWFDSLSYDAVETEFDSAAACSDCYVNEDCPDNCAEPHDMPEPDGRGQWTCPTTGTLYRCDDGGSGEWQWDRWNEGSYYIDGEWFANPWEYGYYLCDGCGEWGYEDYVVYSERNDAYYCDGCRDMYDRGEEADCSRYALCAHTGCRTSLTRKAVHFDPESERTYCAEHAPARAVVYVEVA